MKKKIFKRLLFLVFMIFLGNVSNGQALTVLNIKTSVIKYDAKRDKLYAIVKSNDSVYGNSFIQINPYSGAVENSVFAGSEPICMDITKDTNYVWIGFDGESFVKRLNLNTFQIDRTAGLGIYQGDAGLYAESIATVHISPELVVVSRKRLNVTPRHAGVIAIYYNVILPGATPGHTGSNIIVSANDTNMVFGINTASTEAGFRKMSIDTIIGVTLLNTTTGLGMGDNIEFFDGKVFSSNGKVVQPFLNTPIVIGSYSNIGYNHAVEVDFLNNKTFFATNSGQALLLKRFNYQTYVETDITTFPNTIPSGYISPRFSELVRFGEHGFGLVLYDSYIYNTDRKIILFETCLIKLATDLSIQTSLSPQIIAIGDTVALKYVVANSGIISADSIMLKDTLNSLFEIISYSVTSGVANDSSNIISWHLDSLHSGSSDTLTVLLHMLQAGQFSSSVSVQTASLDCDLTNNTFTYFVNVFNVSIESYAETDNLIRVFPNPFSNNIFIDLSMLPSEKPLQIDILNSTGQCIMEKTMMSKDFENSIYQIDLTQHNVGVYYLLISTENLIRSIKIVKIK